MASRHRWYFGGFLVSGVLLLAAALMSVYEALSVLAGGAAYAGQGLVLAMVGAAAEWVVLSLLLGVLAVVFLCATVVSVLRSKSLPRSDRLAAVVDRLERRYPLLERFDVAGRVAPTVEDRRRRLRERYVAGEIDEGEFEREMVRLMDGDDAVSRTGDRTAAERDRSSRNEPSRDRRG